MPDTVFLHFWFPQGSWLTEESKTPKGGMTVNQQTKIHVALASAPNIVAETPEEEATFRCDPHGIFMDNGILALNEGEKIWSASGEHCESIRMWGQIRPKILHPIKTRLDSSGDELAYGEGE